MTKTLTEQWHEGTLQEGWYYLKVKSELANYPVIAECVINYSSLKPYPDFYEYDDSHVEEVLAPVPSYKQLYGPNDGNIPVGLFTVLKLIKRDIEQYQKIRPLTDLECGIKSQVVSLLKGWGVK